MIYTRTIMQCDCCGERFTTQYHRGGYIDHCINFSDNRSRWGKDETDDIRQICKDGNDLRDSEDIQERLHCYLCCNTVDIAVKASVKTKVDKIVRKIQAAEEKAKGTVKGMTALERKYLIKEAEINCNTPYGTEDWDLFGEE